MSFGGLQDNAFLLDNGTLDQIVPNMSSPNCTALSFDQSGLHVEHFSRKVFVGGLPPDIDEGNNNIYFFIEIL